VQTSTIGAAAAHAILTHYVITGRLLEFCNVSGKHLSLEEARQKNKLAQFAKEHPCAAERPRFDALLETMCKSQPTDPKTSGSEASDD